MIRRMRLAAVACGLALTLCSGTAAKSEVEAVSIICPGRTGLQTFAARQVRRYVYLRTGELLPITTQMRNAADQIVLATGSDDAAAVAAPELREAIRGLGPQEYLLRTIDAESGRTLLIAGGDDAATLYGAYHLAEVLGVRFYLHGDVVPDERIELTLPKVDVHGKPLFETRGIQPFHDFPEGPDWWNRDDYKAILDQLPKLRMNFVGFHTYPQGGVGPEPLVWIGRKDDVGADGMVELSYPARHFTTHNETGSWGYLKKDTGDYAFGAGQVFARDDYGADYMIGMNPWPRQTTEQSNRLFNRMGDFLEDVFGYARALSIQTCVGTEVPLVIPDKVKERLRNAGEDPADPATVRRLYEGIFERIRRTHPLDYYWFWTPEGWTWQGTTQEHVDATVADFQAAIAAADNVRAPFTLATCGWVLGPPSDRALFDTILPKEMPISCINRQVGFDFVEPGFARIQGRPRWAIPWLEDDPAMIIPQLWAGRMRRDAADALAYGCTGLMGIHWRTRILGPNVSALAQAAWDQRGWNPEVGRTGKPNKPVPAEGYRGGNTAAFPANRMPAVYQTVRYDVRAYQVQASEGRYDVTLMFCEPHYEQTGRRVFGVQIEGHPVLSNLDIFHQVGRNRPLDFTFEDVQVQDGVLDIVFVPQVEYPSIAGIVVTPSDSGASRKINCGGPACQEFEADLSALEPPDSRPRDLPVGDFYADWCRSQFGSEVAEPMTRLFVRLDGGYRPNQQPYRQGVLPRPSTWVHGPGGIQPDARPWGQVEKEYDFVDDMEALRYRVASPGCRERFDYWLNNFRYLRAVGKVACTWGQYLKAVQVAKAQQNPDDRRWQARQLVLPARRQLVTDIAEAHRWLLRTVSTPGAMGNIANWQQHVMDLLLVQPGRELAGTLGEPIPADAMPGEEDLGPVRMFVPTVRSSLQEYEPLQVPVVVQGADVQQAAIHYRSLGRGDFTAKPLAHVARGVYSVALDGSEVGADLEYYIDVVTDTGKRLRFPSGAPWINQTVVILPGTER